MSDFEDFFMDWISPGKRKRKKNLKEKERYKKHENKFSIKDQKKKKKKINSKFKDAIVEKKKEKRKKSAKNLKDSHCFCVATFKDSDPHNTDHLTQESKKTKRKKKVSFDLSSSYICAKRPKFVSSLPKEKTLPEKEAVTDITCQVTKIQPSQTQPQDIDSQCTSDDINSQDLFITQKTFRTSYSESSSGEASDKAASQQTMTQRGVLHNSPVLMIKYDGGSNTHFPVHPKMVEQSPLKEEAALIPQVEQNLKNQVKLNTNIIGEKRVYGTAPVKRRTVNQFLEDPIVVKGPLVGTKSSTLRPECPPCLPNRNRPLPTLQTPTASVSTQTENFFTAELSSYLRFRCQRFCLETLEALDLSLPQTATKDPVRCLSETSEVKVDKKKPSEQKASPTAGTMKVSSLQTSSFSEKEAEKLKEPAIRQLWHVKGKGQSAPSPQSDSEPKSADTTSSEDNEPVCSTGKVDLTQVIIIIYVLCL